MGASQMILMGAKQARGRIVGAGQARLMGAWVRQNGCHWRIKSKNWRIFDGVGASQANLMGAWVHEIMPWVQAWLQAVGASLAIIVAVVSTWNNSLSFLHP